MPILRLAAAAIAAVIALASTAYAAKPEIYTGRFNNLAVGGYDTVAFFDDGQPVKGEKEFSTEWKGAEWRFKDEANLEKFKAHPEAFAPQYGGYCAWAMAQGKLAPGYAEYWTVRDGKLYLNFSQKIQDKWLADPDGFIAKADEIWPGILGN
ncbi:MAG: YHS domain-containing (seleno)protein [Parvularculaceae bacterium]